MKREKGFFITLEGCEGAGKTTQVKLLSRKLTQAGFEVVCTREPGGSRTGKAIREILLNPQNTELDAKTEVLLYAADRAQDIKENIKPALEKGMIVLADRFMASNLAYQGYGRGLSLERIKRINKWVIGDSFPDLTIIIDIDVKKGLQRARNFSPEGDRLETEQIEFHKRVRKGFLQLLEEDDDQRFIRFDGELPSKKLSELIFAAVKERLK